MSDEVMKRTNTADDAAQAFEGMRREIFAQRGEMALLMRKVEEVLLREDIKIPDYTATLAATNQILGKHQEQLTSLAGSPMLRLLPGDYQSEMERARIKEREATRGETVIAHRQLIDAIETVRAVLTQVNSVKKQRQMIGAAAVSGAVVWFLASWLIF